MTMTIINPQAVQEFTKAFGGQVLLQGDQGYEEARKVHNGLIDKHPAVIARCRNTADIVEAVKFALSLGLEIAVRGGGHNVAGRSAVDMGMCPADDRSIMASLCVPRTKPGATNRPESSGPRWRIVASAASMTGASKLNDRSLWTAPKMPHM